jgi:hypothetical protein
MKHYKTISQNKVDIEIGYKEPKQETLEDAAERLYPDCNNVLRQMAKETFIEGAKWQQERSYSEEEVIAFGEFIFKHSLLTHTKGVKNLFKEFKNK